MLAAVSMGLARANGLLWTYAGPLAATLSLGAFIEACRKRNIARGEVGRMSKLIAGGLAWFLLASGLMGFCLGVAASNWVIGIAGGLVTAMAAALLRRVLRGILTAE